MDVKKGWSVVEGTTCREVELTIRTVSDLTEEERKNFHKEIVSVSKLTSLALKIAGRRPLSIKTVVNNREKLHGP